ncbi:MAG: Lrp/AsnC family transcriptional regulator [Xanthobacteraceae bacterium]|nr:MAG: Lrp/AsnC family transcriptional regulator [Xanthobacteraceae bacterium]
MVNDDLDRHLIDRWQRDFPLAERPYAEIGAALGLAGDEVMARLERLLAHGALSRVGAVVRPNTVGASTLAAVAAPSGDIERVAALIGDEPGVNHNYEREHAYNLWFVATGASTEAVRESLKRIERRTGLAVLDLPLVRAFHIDLGFPLFSDDGMRGRGGKLAPPGAADADDSALLRAIEGGLPLVERPYAAVAEHLDWSEMDVRARLGRLIEAGIVRRFGLVVQHRSFGYEHNAMVVWDVPAAQVEATGHAFAARPFVTLCYQRPRRPPHWRYNLFTMIHGRDRAEVERQIATLAAIPACGLVHEILFSRRCFRQRGARLSA